MHTKLTRDSKAFGMPLNQNEIVEGMNRLPPEYAGMLMAMFISFLRVVYDDKETSKIRICLESLICGGLSLTASSGIVALGLDMNWAIFVGGTIGYFGSATVRALALKVINKKIK